MRSIISRCKLITDHYGCSGYSESRFGYTGRGSFVAFLFFTLPTWGLNTPIGVFVYLGLFGIVLLHEFGHALACRSVGGKADTIMLWPLGGIAFVQPPQRPGAVLWSIAAGPLVNLVLAPILIGAWILVSINHTETAFNNAILKLTFDLMAINIGLFIFNMLPIYPLDGGQILQAILWFFIGQVRSLKVSAAIGIFCSIVGGAYFLTTGNIWLVIIAGFVGLQSYRGWKVAQYLSMQGGGRSPNPWDQ